MADAYKFLGLQDVATAVGEEAGPILQNVEQGRSKQALVGVGDTVVLQLQEPELLYQRVKETM
jgi:hypothetical protein